MQPGYRHQVAGACPAKDTPLFGRDIASFTKSQRQHDAKHGIIRKRVTDRLVHSCSKGQHGVEARVMARLCLAHVRLRTNAVAKKPTLVVETTGIAQATRGLDPK